MRPWVCALALMGCAGADHVLLREARPAVEGPDTIVRRGQATPEGLVDVALLHAWGKGFRWRLVGLTFSEGRSGALEALREEARNLGCDMVVRVDLITDGARDAQIYGVCAAATSTSARLVP